MTWRAVSCSFGLFLADRRVPQIGMCLSVVTPVLVLSADACSMLMLGLQGLNVSYLKELKYLLVVVCHWSCA